MKKLSEYSIEIRETIVCTSFVERKDIIKCHVSLPPYLTIITLSSHTTHKHTHTHACTHAHTHTHTHRVYTFLEQRSLDKICIFTGTLYA